MNSQSFDVDKKIRDTTDGMILQTSFLNMFTLSRPISRHVALVEASSTGDSRIADNLKFDSILNWRISFMPKYFKYFQSFSAPPREPISFKQIAGDLKDLKRNNVMESIKKYLGADDDENN